MSLKAKLIIVITVLVNFFAFTPVFAAAAGSDSEDLLLMNSNRCARESQKPATGFYLYADGLTAGRAVAKLAKSKSTDVNASVKAAWTELHRTLFFVVHSTLQAVASKQLPLVQSPADVKPEHIQLIIAQNSTPSFSCLRIKKSFPALLNPNNVAAQDLEKLAIAYLDAGQYVDSCENIDMQDAEQPELVLRFNTPNDNLSFEFWNSVKIYLSAAWKAGIFQKKAPVYGRWLQSFPLEEMTLLIPDGCRSLSAPACKSDFLSQSNLTDLLSTQDFKNSALLVKELGGDQLNVNPFNAISKGVTPVSNPQEMMKNLTRVRQQAADLQFKSQKLLTALFHQKSASALTADIEKAITDTANWDEFESACVENRIFTDVGISAIATELQNNGSLISHLEKNSFPGSSSTESLQNVVSLTNSLKALCKKHEPRFLEGKGTAGAKPWVKSYFLTVLTPEMVDGMIKVAPATTGDYLRVGSQTLCTSALNCWREAMESAVRLYQVAHKSSTIFKQDSVLDTDLNKNLSSTVACKVYDPWAANHNRFKKLLLDTASAVATGVVQLPIYLDIEPTQKRVASFKELLDKDAVKLDPVFWREGWKKTLMLDLGPLAHSPCMISITADGSTPPQNSSYVFSGISGNMCKSGKKIDTQQDSVSMTSAQQSGQAYCGHCSLNFERVATSVARTGFGVFGAGLRFLGGVVRFFKSEKDPLKKPAELTVDPEFLMQAYQKYGSIPEKCVYELTHEAPCMKNICASKTVAELQEKFNLKAEKVQIFNSPRTVGKNQGPSNDKIVRIKAVGCAKEIFVPIVCSGKTVPKINWSSARIPKACRGLVAQR